jgi:hypothetical protein
MSDRHALSAYLAILPQLPGCPTKFLLTCLRPIFRSPNTTIRTATAKMPRLLDIPNELIFDIVGLALITSPISIPSDAKRRQHVEHKNVYYIDSDVTYQPNALALLLVCKQLSAQTALYISKSPRVSEFDIALINAVDMFPTWRYIPTRNGSAPAILDRVVVNLTPCYTTGSLSILRNRWPTRYSAGNVDEYYWVERLLTAIQQHFAVGALGKISTTIKFAAWSEYPADDLEVPLPIRTRALVISADTHRQTEAAFEGAVVPARQVESHIYPSYDALYPIRATQNTRMMEWIASCIDRRLRSMSNIQSILFVIERVGRIEFRVDGELIREIKVADYRGRNRDGMFTRLWGTRDELGL